ncbi:thioredoxin TrxC [Stakelama marina]|uniref:Thioredoxin n=1 Tax=Stakelama marina TaxID=2826939 RepID=A0A8T4IE68_9SPHN|nr:thioredoxin TrxC [Stakelama marina]MBR0551285.1 thioredoxin TrxC [Stakelama marina]
MNALTIMCGNCGTLNRVPEARLGDGPNCGKCGQPLVTGKPLAVNMARFDRLVGKGSQPVLADFWASWCGPCRMMEPAFAAAAGDLDPQVRLVKVDTEAEQQLAARFGIRSIPTMILFSDGREIARQAGAMDKNGIVRWVRSALA